MRILFAGSVAGNSGPGNVNRRVIENWPTGDEVRLLDSVSKRGRVLEGVKNGEACDVLLYTDTAAVSVALQAAFRMMRKPCVYLCHGWLPFENEVNELGIPRYKVGLARRCVEATEVVVANSALQMGFLEREMPGYRGLLTYVNLGADEFEQMPRSFRVGRAVVAVSGGTRPIKANEVVLRAVRLLRGRGTDCELRVYGDDYARNDELSEAFRRGEAVFMGQVPQGDFVRQLNGAEVFVMNSRHEPFGLSALDALHAGASLLLSRNCGVCEVLGLEEGDVVGDCEDASEVADKIGALLLRPNSERLYRSLDFGALSWGGVSERLRDACAEAVRRSGSGRCE